MWLLHLLPMGMIALIVHGVLLLGIVGLAASYLIKLVPTLGIYSGAARIAAIVIIVVAVYLEGVYNTDLWYQNQVKDLQNQVAVSEEKSKTLNTSLATALNKETKIIQVHTDTLHTEIREKLVPIDKNCTLDPSVITILNNGATTPLTNKSPAVSASGDSK